MTLQPNLDITCIFKFSFRYFCRVSKQIKISTLGKISSRETEICFSNYRGAYILGPRWCLTFGAVYMTYRFNNNWHRQSTCLRAKRLHNASLLKCLHFSQHTVLGQHRPTNKTPFKWRFVGWPILARFYLFIGSQVKVCCLKFGDKCPICFYVHCNFLGH